MLETVSSVLVFHNVIIAVSPTM